MTEEVLDQRIRMQMSWNKWKKSRQQWANLGSAVTCTLLQHVWPLSIFIVIELLLLMTSITRTSDIIKATHNTWEIFNAYRKKVRISQYLNTL